jgi:TatD DNase family protein
MSDAAPVPLVDTHAHLQDPAFDDDRDAVLARAEASGLRAFVCVGYDLASSRRAVELAAAHDRVHAAVGIHPNSANTATEADWAAVRELARRPKVVGVGETGLDNYRKYTPPAVQERWLIRHLELADETGLPVIIHNRQADGPLRARLREWLAGAKRAGRSAPGVMHCFAADRAMLEACLELGLMISIAGPVTYKNAEPLRAVARQVPADRLVVETDCPYLAPHPHRGRRNEPGYVAHTARYLAELRGEPFSALAERTTRTAAGLFGLPRQTAPGVDRP